MFVHLPYLSTDRARRLSADTGYHEKAPASCRPSKAGKPLPLALVRRTGGSVLVEQCCANARRLGVRPGISLGQAQALAPGLQALEHAPPQDQALLTRIASWALRFSPVVESLSPPFAPGILVDITGCARLFESEWNIARQALAELTRRGFVARAAVADTVGGAYALATARLDPIVIVPAGQTVAWIAPLPPSSLRVDAQTSHRLDSLGVRSIADLLTLPRASLPARFGSELVMRLGQALGEAYEGVAAHHPNQPPSARMILEEPVCELAVVQAILAQLLREVLDMVEERGQTLRRVRLVLYYERVMSATVSIGLSRGSRCHKHIFELLSRRLESVDLSPGVCGLMLLVRQTSPWRPAQARMFERPAAEEEAFGVLIDRIANRLGYEAVVRAKLIEDYEPEMAFRYVSVAQGEALADAEDKQNAPKNASEHGSKLPFIQPRPLQLVRRPIPIRVMSLVPDGPPTWFYYRSREHKLTGAVGPERLETAWWRGRDVRRDYYRVTSETGEQFWIFREMNDGRWYLHGVFD